jgi:DNA repair ATPase RecN
MELNPSELENDNYEDNSKSSNQYMEKINQLDSGIHILLHEFKKLYVITKMNPNNQEYQTQYQNVINSLAEILSKLFSVSNDVQVNIEDMNKKLLAFDILIRKEREKNRELKRKLGSIEHENNAASEMISNYKDIYDQRYLRNWALLLSSIIGIVAIGTIYKKQGV